ncbi:hypothetical protein ACQVPW_07790 [Bacillus cereus]|uniref:Lipoprotein n=1 Tax=Bacillus proteolyticus TaxID=2026192 RepID=A0ABV3IJG3_9BACI|nr:hypothetical protein [Bacillus cereus group sp. N8]MBJ8107635.1 hypothetical protein [Bacillus cereus group sp. N8]HDR8170435.1 hypothetical protein [Bacillus thuringiensis]
MKYFCKSLSLGIALLLLASCQQKTMTFQEIFPVKHITKLEITKGNGEKKIITDETKINNWLKKVKETKFNPKKNQEKRVGYLYAVKMYDREKEIGSFTTSKINDYYYERNTNFEGEITNVLN